MLIVGQDRTQISKLKEELAESFEMKDLGPAKQILGMEITRDRKNRRLWLSQERYVERILERFNMKEAKPVTTFVSLVVIANSARVRVLQQKKKTRKWLSFHIRQQWEVSCMLWFVQDQTSLMQ